MLNLIEISNFSTVFMKILVATAQCQSISVFCYPDECVSVMLAHCHLCISLIRNDIEYPSVSLLSICIAYEVSTFFFVVVVLNLVLFRM